MSTIAENIANIRAQMAEAAKKAGRDPSEILLCAATKMNDAERVKEAVAAGVDCCGENRVQEISEITRNLKITAKELNVPIIVLSQLSRSVEKNGSSSRRPQLSDLRDSGSIEQDADAVLFLYREAYYNRQNSEDNQADENVAECIVAKNRHGEVDTVKLSWDGSYTRFASLETYRDAP